jgi:methyl-accepting chemotaxis protein
MLIKVFEAHSHQMTVLKEAISTSYKLNSDVLVLRKNEKNFLSRLSWDDIKKFQTNSEILVEDLNTLSKLLSDKSELSYSLSKVSSSLQDYKKRFEAVCSCYEKIGIDYDHGLKSKVKQAYSRLEALMWHWENRESSDSENLQNYRHQTLKLAINEKNFLIRPSQKYIERFRTCVTEITQDIDGDLFLSKSDKQLFMSLLTDYSDLFYHLSNLMLEMDHSPNSPLVSLSQSAREIEALVQSISSKIVDDIIISEKGARTYSTLILLSFAFGMLSIALIPFLLLMTSQNQPLLHDERYNPEVSPA